MGLMMHLSGWVMPAFNRTGNNEQPTPATPGAGAKGASPSKQVSCKLKFSTRHRRRMGWARFRLHR